MENITAFDYYKYEHRELGWNTPADYMDYVHPHWRQFEAPNPFLHYMLGVFYTGFMFASLIGNGVVIWVFASAKSLQTPSNLFVINLAILDFIMMVKTPVFIINSFNEGPIWGKLGCDIFALLGSYSGIGGAATNAAIAFDRYRTIARPFDGKLNRTQALGLCVLCWLYATPFSLMPFFNIWGRFVPEGFLTTCSFDYISDDISTKYFVATVFVTSYVLPMTCIIYFYSQLVSHVRQHEESLRAQAKKMNVESLRSSKDQNETSAEIRIAKVAIGLFAMFVISWTPYAIVALICAFGNRALITPFVSMLPALTCKAVACIDPWIYAINHPRYRLELQKRMPWFCIHEPEPPKTDSSSVSSEKTVATNETS
ncbi:opsin, ultraviolet-sensitive-like [Artemia franciscana]|uniref:G-protein coupled receptors family 1 profile domain-containing protein n=1 Tax=Artemia franciscana TaxID=6661 RepID=A0AA88II78_ARTSF|nr:hypothetical protein QYM36_003554 [Artemia franciscana]